MPKRIPALLTLPFQGDMRPTLVQRDSVIANAVNQLVGIDAESTFDPASLADGAGETTTVTVPGAALGDFAIASFSLDLQGISVSAYVSSADTVSVRFQNESGGLLDLGSGTLRVRVLKQ